MKKYLVISKNKYFLEDVEKATLLKDLSFEIDTATDKETVKNRLKESEYDEIIVSSDSEDIVKTLNNAAGRFNLSIFLAKKEDDIKMSKYDLLSYGTFSSSSKLIEAISTNSKSKIKTDHISQKDIMLEDLFSDFEEIDPGNFAKKEKRENSKEEKKEKDILEAVEKEPSRKIVSTHPVVKKDEVADDLADLFDTEERIEFSNKGISKETSKESQLPVSEKENIENAKANCNLIIEIEKGDGIKEKISINDLFNFVNSQEAGSKTKGAAFEDVEKNVKTENSNAEETNETLEEKEDEDVVEKAFKEAEPEALEKSEKEEVTDEIDKSIAIDLGDEKTPAKVITIYSAKGGVGKTTISCELAAYLALTEHARSTYNVCVVDYNIDFGDVGTTLDLDNAHKNMTAWADDIERRIENGANLEELVYGKNDIMGYLHRDETSGLYALLSPKNSEDAARISEEALKVMLDNIKNYAGFDFVIVDTGNNTQDASFLALESADTILIVLTQDVRSVHCNQEILSTLQLLDFNMEKVFLIINQIESTKKTGLSSEEIEDCLINPQTNRPYRCAARIRRDKDVMISNNEGTPLVYDATHEFSKQIGELARVLVGNNHVLEAKPKKKKFLGLF